MYSLASSLHYSISLPRILLKAPYFTMRTVWFFCFIALIPLFGFYLFQVNKMAEEGYLLASYETRFSQLSQDNQNLQVNSAQANSLQELEALVNNLNFEKTDEVDYIKIIDSRVAAR